MSFSLTKILKKLNRQKTKILQSRRQFYYDAKEQIDEDCQNLFGAFINAIKQQNKAIIEKQAKEYST